MRELRTFYNEHVPTTDDLQECIKISRAQNCIISLKWNVYYREYEVIISPEDTFKDIEGKVPKVYGI